MNNKLLFHYSIITFFCITLSLTIKFFTTTKIFNNNDKYLELSKCSFNQFHSKMLFHQHLVLM